LKQHRPIIELSCGHQFCVHCIAKPLQSSSQCPVCRRPLIGLAEQAASVLRDTLATAVARGVPATKLALVEKRMWRMVSDVAMLEPPVEKRALTLPPLKSSSSEPLLRSKDAGLGVGGRSHAAHNSLRVVVLGADAAVSADPGVKSSSPEKSDPGAHIITGSVKVASGAGKWRQRHKRVHLDEPISIAELTAPPPKSRAAAAVEQESRAAAAVEQEARDQTARQVAYLIGSLRDRAQATGGEIDRNSFYAALVQHGMLEDVSSTAFTKAPDELFDAIDKDRSGLLSIGELEAAVYGLLEDPSGVGAIEEWLSHGNDVMQTSVKQMNTKLKSQMSKMVALFKKWDRDGDGAVSREEFARALPLLGLTGNTQKEIDALFDSFDPDGSGEVTFREMYRSLSGEEDSVKSNQGETVETIADLSVLRQRVKLDLFRMQIEHEVLDWARERRKEVTVPNPSMPAGLFSGLRNRTC